jgi:hypothetical protein
MVRGHNNEGKVQHHIAKDELTSQAAFTFDPSLKQKGL